MLLVPVLVLGVAEPGFAQVPAVEIDMPEDDATFENGVTVEVEGTGPPNTLLSITLINSYPGGTITTNGQVTTSAEGDWVFNHPSGQGWQVWDLANGVSKFGILTIH